MTLEVLRRLKLGPLIAWLAFAVGLLLGLLANRVGLGGSVGDVVSSALGAAIAVIGAILYTEHKDRALKEQQRLLLAMTLGQVWAISFTFRAVLIQSEWKDVSTSAVTRCAKKVRRAWEMLITFRPYDKADNPQFSEWLLRIDDHCQEIEDLVSGLTIEQPLKDQAHLIERLISTSDSIQFYCNDLLPLLGFHWFPRDAAGLDPEKL